MLSFPFDFALPFAIPAAVPGLSWRRLVPDFVAGHCGVWPPGWQPQRLRLALWHLVETADDGLPVYLSMLRLICASKPLRINELPSF